jgi:hydroxyacylglutathione hydrolase
LNSTTRTIPFVLLISAALIGLPAFALEGPGVLFPSDLNVKWIHGSPDCATTSDPAIQVHRFDPNTYILRESKCYNFEGPFLYLLIGEKRALLLDSGAAPRPGLTFPIRTIVDEILADSELDKKRPDLELIVAHSHSHRDHKYGDSQFADRPHTTVIKPEVAAIKEFFKLPNWPADQAVLDLGDRSITIIPLPGHEQGHIAIYDAKTGILLTGDTLYPGLLTVDDWPAYRSSVHRLSQFASTHKVTYILGAHIEMTAEPRKMYPLMTTFQPREHVLQLELRHLLELEKAVDALGDHPKQDVHDDFIIQPRTP